MIFIKFNPECCTLCPRTCRADRTKKSGFCGGENGIRAAAAMLHFWEEPCISGKNGSGAVFFSGCALRCCFCQNEPISNRNFGKNLSPERLAEIFLEFQEQGANNINLVTAGHVLPWVIPALERAKPELHIPVIYNSGGYELAETLRELDGFIDVYLPDFSFSIRRRRRITRTRRIIPESRNRHSPKCSVRPERPS